MNPQIMTWLGRHQLLLITSGIVALIAIPLIAFISLNCIVVLNVKTDIANEKIVSYISTDTGTEEIGGTGLHILPRSAKSIIVTAGAHIKTQAPLDMPWYAYTEKNVLLLEDRNADKVAFNSSLGATCSTYSKRLDQLLYYTCRNPKTLLKYNTPTDKSWGSTAIASIQYSTDNIMPYMGGIIGIADHLDGAGQQDSNIAVTTDEGKLIAYKLPEQVNHENLRDVRIYTDTSNTDNNRFAVVDATGAIYLGTPQSGTNVSYMTLEAPKDYDPLVNQTLCTITGANAYCYRGISPVGDLPDNSKLKKVPGYAITSASFTDGKSEVRSISNADLSLDTLVAVDGKLFGKSYKKLVAFQEAGNKYTSFELAQNVDSITSGKQLYYAQQNGIFEYDHELQESHQLFYSPYIKVKSLYYTDARLFFIGSAGTDTKTTYAYRLTDTANTSTRRLIDYLPAELPNSFSSDLVGNRLAVRLNDATRRNASRTYVDNLKVSQAKSNIENALTEQGIDLTSLSIELKY